MKLTESQAMGVSSAMLTHPKADVEKKSLASVLTKSQMRICLSVGAVAGLVALALFSFWFLYLEGVDASRLLKAGFLGVFILLALPLSVGAAAFSVLAAWFYRRSQDPNRDGHLQAEMLEKRRQY